MKAKWNQSGRVGVLMGGSSAEREISLQSGRAIFKALKRLGISAVEIDLQDDWPQQISEADIQTAMLALHGWQGEDGCVQGLLEIMRIAYTGSDLRSASLCMHKRLSKSLL
ncbi:MAG: D-alanine--D-alanine ligase, partial [Mariprofundaceae bacterium]